MTVRDFCGNNTAKVIFSLIIMFLVAFCLGAWLGHSDYFKNTIQGIGSFEQRSDFGDTLDVASAANGVVNYRAEATWTDGITSMQLTETYEVTASPKLKGMIFSNRYAVGVFSAGYNHKLEAYNIEGNFSGSAKFVTADASIDSVIVMDSRTGNASFTGAVVNQRVGKHPLTESETLAVGKFIIKQALNATDPVTNDDPLAFCYKLDKDMILDPTVPDGVYIAPPGMILNTDGKLVKQAKVIS